MRYLLRTNTGYEHLAKFERAVLTHVGRNGSVMAVCQQSFFVRSRLLATENGLVMSLLTRSAMWAQISAVNTATKANKVRSQCGALN